MKRSEHREHELGLILDLFRAECQRIHKNMRDGQRPVVGLVAAYAAARRRAVDAIFTAMRKVRRQEPSV